jgi:hypothetical protein
MHWFSAADYWLTSFVLVRAVAVIYLIAFVGALDQFRPLLGERGLMPVPRFLRTVSFRDAPSLFHLRYSDRLLTLTAWCGALLAGATLGGLPERGPVWLPMLTWAVMWALYLSIVNVGQTFYSFGWESLLLEAGFLAIFLGPSSMAPPVLTIYLFRWLVFRLEFGAGLIKMRGDPCWRALSCLDYHHETQPMPNPLSWYFHHLPRFLHRVEVLGNHAAQLVVPWMLLAPQPVADIAAAVIVVTQGWLVLSGNFAWLNVLTIACAVSAFDGSWLHHVIPIATPASLDSPPLWFEAVVIAVTAGVAAMSWWPVRNMASPHQRMNASFNRWHLVNTYGAFGSVTCTRPEIVVEGSDAADLRDDTAWKAYEFKGKPTDLRRRPPQVAPYHLRLDWLMWFAALSPSYAYGWFLPFVEKLLEGDRDTLRLLRHNPFPDTPPRHVRAMLYRYRFTTSRERRESGAWWSRELIGEYLGPVSLPDAATARGPLVRVSPEAG